MAMRLRPVPIIAEYLRYRLEEYNNLMEEYLEYTSDGSNSLNLGTNIAAVKNVWIDGEEKEWFIDWERKWDESGNSILHFRESPTSGSLIRLKILKGISWVKYSPIEIRADLLPILMLDTTFSPADRAYSLGLYGPGNKRYWRHSVVITATVWFEQDKPYTWNNRTYWGDEFGYYVQDVLSELFVKDYDYLLKRNIEFQNGYGLMRLMIGPEAEQPPYIARVQKNYVFRFFVPIE